eukprot:351768-Chlamydomonas_euryale.AAC.1
MESINLVPPLPPRLQRSFWTRSSRSTCWSTPTAALYTVRWPACCACACSCPACPSASWGSTTRSSSRTSAPTPCAAACSTPCAAACTTSCPAAEAAPCAAADTGPCAAACAAPARLHVPPHAPL